MIDLCSCGATCSEVEQLRAEIDQLHARIEVLTANVLACNSVINKHNRQEKNN